MATNNATIDPKTGVKSFFGVTEWYPETPQEILSLKLLIIEYIDSQDPEDFVRGEEWASLKRTLKVTCTKSWNELMEFSMNWKKDKEGLVRMWGSADDIRTELMWIELTGESL